MSPGGGEYQAYGLGAAREYNPAEDNAVTRKPDLSLFSDDELLAECLRRNLSLFRRDWGVKAWTPDAISRTSTVLDCRTEKEARELLAGIDRPAVLVRYLHGEWVEVA